MALSVLIDTLPGTTLPLKSWILIVPPDGVCGLALQVVEARASAKDLTVVAAAAAAASTEAAALGPARRRGMSVSALPTGLKHGRRPVITRRAVDGMKRMSMVAPHCP